jgi:hypothetical protein
MKEDSFSRGWISEKAAKRDRRMDAKRDRGA